MGIHSLVYLNSHLGDLLKKSPSNDLLFCEHSILLWVIKLLLVVKVTKKSVNRGLGYSCLSCQGLKFLKCKLERQSSLCVCVFI